jgi:hypothetical protein
MKKGIISKLVSDHQSIVEYKLPLSDDSLPMNDLVGKKIKITHTGNKFCVKTGKKVKKTFGQGYSWESFITSPECDQCIFQPELCHYSKGTCRDEKWGETHCMQPHVIYLSLTSNLKIGSTRKTQVPTRWVDQGAVAAIKLCEVSNRLTSGKIEVEIARTMGDKTNWRNMLKNSYPETDLLEAKQKILKDFKPLLEKHKVEILDDEVYKFNYPVDTYPEKVSSLNFDKNPVIESTLMGIKGQYFIFETGVINMRKYQGYEVEVEY